MCAVYVNVTVLRLILCVVRQPRQGRDRLIGLVVRAFASGVEDLGCESCLRQDISGSSLISDLKIGTPVATLPL